MKFVLSVTKLVVCNICGFTHVAHLVHLLITLKCEKLITLQHALPHCKTWLFTRIVNYIGLDQTAI